MCLLSPIIRCNATWNFHFNWIFSSRVETLQFFLWTSLHFRLHGFRYLNIMRYGLFLGCLSILFTYNSRTNMYFIIVYNFQNVEGLWTNANVDDFINIKLHFWYTFIFMITITNKSKHIFAIVIYSVHFDRIVIRQLHVTPISSFLKYSLSSLLISQSHHVTYEVMYVRLIRSCCFCPKRFDSIENHDVCWPLQLKGYDC